MNNKMNISEKPNAIRRSQSFPPAFSGKIKGSLLLLLLGFSGQAFSQTPYPGSAC